MLFALKNAKGIFMSKLKQRKQEKRLLDKIRKKNAFFKRSHTLTTIQR
jgi:hypothetical protein